MWKWMRLALLAGLVARATAQEITVPMKDYSAEESIFAPFVSRIRVGVRRDTVVLTWVDPEGLSGECVVYRFSEPITSETFRYAQKIASVPIGTGRYEDRISEKGEYFYAILALDRAKRLYEVFIPFKNATAVGIEPELAEQPKAAQNPELPNQVTGISARVEGDAVIVDLSVPALGHRLILYRGSEQITDSAGILSASIVSIFDDSKARVEDYPVPGIDYYYAVIDEVNLKNSDVTLTPGVNATVSPVRIASGAYRVGLPDVSPLSRSLPLPYLVVDSSIGSGERIGSSISIASPAAISSETEKAIDNILAGLKAEEIAAPETVILNPELIEPSSGEEYTLGMIVRETIKTGKWPEAISQIEKFLSLQRSRDTEIRSRFYLGQAYAMSGMYRNALFSLLIAQDSDYARVKPWIEFCLKSLRAES